MSFFKLRVKWTNCRLSVIVQQINGNISSIHLCFHVNLGVLSENPSSTIGAGRIVDKLQEYCRVVDGCPIEVVVNGNALSMERMV